MIPTRPEPRRSALTRLVLAVAPGLAVVFGTAACLESETTSSGPEAPDGGGIDAPVLDTSTTPGPDGAKPADAALRDARADADADAPLVIPMTVRGKVVDLLGDPIAGARVVTSLGRTVTDRDGAFSVSAASGGYDITVWWPAQRTVLAVLGVVRTDPILQIPVFDSMTGGATLVSGTVPALTSDQATSVKFAPDAHAQASTTLVAGTDSAYELEVSWPNANAATGKLWLFSSTIGSDSTASSFIGVGSQAVTFESKESKVVHLTASAVSTGVVHAVMTMPVNYRKFLNPALVRMPGSPQRMAVNYSRTDATSFSLPVPVLDGAVYSIDLAAQGPMGSWSRVRKKVPLSGTLVETLPPAVILEGRPSDTPIADATTVFGWSAEPGVKMAHWIPEATDTYATDAPRLIVVTSGPTARLPDVTSLRGTSLPFARFQWGVTSYPTLASVDDFVAAPRGLAWTCVVDDGFGPEERTCTESGDRDVKIQ